MMSRKTEHETGKNKSHFRDICDYINDAIFVYDLTERKIIDANRRACEMYGYSYAEITTKGLAELSSESAPYSSKKAAEIINNAASGEHQLFEWHAKDKNGRLFWVEISLRLASVGEQKRIIAIVRDITERKKAEETINKLNKSLESRLIALTQPVGDVSNIQLADLFNMDELQKIQDAFADATGVASIITDIDGKPITKPSNFCRLCNEVIRKTKKGLLNCYCSDAELGRMHKEGPIMQRCLSGGLWDAGTSICVGERHIANWLIGQILEEPVDEKSMIAYAHEIGADENVFKEALSEVTRMPLNRFKKVTNALYLIANQLSKLAIQNVQQAQFITERKKIEKDLRQREAELRLIIDLVPHLMFVKDRQGKLLLVNKAFANAFNSTVNEMQGKLLSSIHKNPDEVKLYQKSDNEVIETGKSKFIPEEPFTDIFGKAHVIQTAKIPYKTLDGKICGALGIAIDITEQKRAEEDKKAFYRLTILNATDGKLEICDANDVNSIIKKAKICIDIEKAQDAMDARRIIKEALLKYGLDEDVLCAFMIAIGEAIANALKHAAKGKVYAGRIQNEIMVAVEDKGPGIESLILPGAVLRRGFSTKPSMGFGYSIMLDTADRIMLKTDSTGTTVVLIKNLKNKRQELSIYPDTWGNISDTI